MVDCTSKTKTNFSVQCGDIPESCCGIYTKIIRQHGIGFVKVNEAFQPTYSISRNKVNERWELKEARQDTVIAFVKSRATSPENITAQWTLADEGRKFTFKLVAEGRRGRKRTMQQDCKGNKKTKREFGTKLVQEYKPRGKVSIAKQKPRLTDDELPKILECDRRTAEDELFVVSYVEDIMKHYSEQEGNFLAKRNYIKKVQKTMKESSRWKMVNWLGAVVTKFEQTDASFHLAVNIFDRYLSLQEVPTAQLQLVGCVCLWLASKYIEIQIPEMSDFVYISDHAFDTDDMLRVETDVVNALDFEMTVPTAHSFGQRYSHIVKFMMRGEKQKRRLPHLATFYIEYCSLIYELVGEKPSKIAAAATYAAAFWLCRTFQWNTTLVEKTGYSVEELQPIVDLIKYTIYDKPKKEDRCPTKPHVVKKYESEEREHVALMRYTRT